MSSTQPIELLATTLLPEQAKPSRSIMRMVLPIRQFYLGLALRGSCQAVLNRVCKPQVPRFRADHKTSDLGTMM
jgi:hypothetical protein